jgi:Na+/melibiose symporter-like transporter
VVMNHVAGPSRRYDLMSRRWSIIGLTTAVLVAVAGVVLEHIPFPLNYQVVFIALTLGGASSFYFCNKIELPESVPTVRKRGVAPLERIKGYYRLLAGQGDFVRLSLQQFVFSFGSLFALPLFPLYYVRSVNASDAWIGVISTLQTLLALVGYYMWPRTTRRRGSRFVLLATTLGLSLHPALAGITHSVQLIVVYAALAGIFQAGLDLVFFDELLKTVPAEQSATFISLAQMLQYVATFAGPVVGTLLADRIGLGGALLTGAALRLVGFALFALWPGSGRPAPAAASGSAG